MSSPNSVCVTTGFNYNSLKPVANCYFIDYFFEKTERGILLECLKNRTIRTFHPHTEIKDTLHSCLDQCVLSEGFFHNLRVYLKSNYFYSFDPSEHEWACL
jgi:hypothetical protein